MKKTLLLIVVTVFLGSVIGCSGGEGENMTPDAPTKADPKANTGTQTGEKGTGNAAPELPPPPTGG